MRTLLLVAVASAVFLGVAQGAVAPGVCVNVVAGANALILFVTDPEPHLTTIPDSFFDAITDCEPPF